MDLKDIKVVLCDTNKFMTACWDVVFKQYENVKIFNGSLDDLFKKSKGIECIVSPANSFGMMDGGYDLAITNYYKNKDIDIISIVQNQLATDHLGEQPVNTAMLIRDESIYPKLIHTPTMRFPMDIQDTDNVYMCMKETLLCAMRNNIKTIVIPAFGGGCGRVRCEAIAKQMFMAYLRVLDGIPNIKDRFSCWNFINYELNYLKDLR